jgi:PAS domain S-box-containing protein
MNEKQQTDLCGSSSPQMLRALLAAIDAHAIVSFTDGGGTINWVNSRFCEISGYSAEELLGQNHSMLRSGVHPPEFYREMWRTIVRGRIWNGEICNRRKNGQLYWVASTIMPIQGEHGRPESYVSIRTDITAVKDSEIQLRHKRDLQILISDVAAALLASGGARLDAAIDRVLALCGAAFNVDRAWIHLHSEGIKRQPRTGEWRAHGVGTNLHRIQQHLHGGSPWWEQQLRQGKVVIDDVGTLPAAARREQAVFGEQGIKALLAVPLRTATEICGVLGLDCVHAPRAWSEEHVRMLGVLADLFVTAQARIDAEDLSEANKERLRRGQIHANIGTWDWNITTGELFWTERIGPLFGYEDGELETSYDNFLKAVHPEDRTRLVAAVNACVEHDVPYDIEHRVIWPDGRVRWLQERGAVTRDASGRATQMLGVVQDIHDRKQAELRLAEREQLLREAQTLAHIGNWTAWQRTGHVDWSDEIYRIFGYEPGSFQPSVEAFMATVHPDDRSLVAASEARSARTGSMDVTHRIVRPDGSIRYVHEVARMVLDDAGHPLLLTGTVQDVTELKRTELALIAARDEAERANRAKSQFLSSMSHELRTPLNAILGFSQLMVEQALPAEQQQESAQEIFLAGEHLLNLINEILDLARIEAGKVELKLDTVCGRDVLRDCLSLVRTLAEQYVVTLVCDADTPAPVIADSIRLKQVLVNLLSNAIKYNRSGGQVKARISVGENLTRISVEDTGMGIVPERQQELFQPFSRLDAESLQVEGTGMGLNISKHLIELMGGGIGVESVPGRGSVFWITLPTVAVKSTEAGTAPTSVNASFERASRVVKRVLYVEDNPTNVKLVRRMLAQRRDVQLLSAHTPELGLEMAASAHPHLILLDINLPGMDGYQLLRLLQADPDLCAIPVVAVSAYAMHADIERGLAAGFADYITKPVNALRLMQTLDRILASADSPTQIEIL